MILKFELLIVGFLVIGAGSILGGLASFFAILYYLSMTKINVIDIKHDGSWRVYLKSMLKKLIPACKK